MTKRKYDDLAQEPDQVEITHKKRRKRGKRRRVTPANNHAAIFEQNENPVEEEYSYDEPKHSPFAWPDNKRNNHLEQALYYHDELHVSQTPFDNNSRILSDSIPRTKYYSRKGFFKSAMHWGQRKLLLSEIEFLTNYGQDGRTVLYAGAAPGTHITYLSKLFPELSFILVDPRDFHIRSSGNVTIIQEFFTDELAYKYRGLGVLFISDIRTASWQDMEQNEVEEYVEKDNIAQLRWHGILRPLRSMLKFRLPWSWSPVYRRYLDGDIYLPVFGPQTTTETRLVPLACPEELMKEAEEERKQETIVKEKDPTHWCATKVYDCLEYQERMFHFNTETRMTYYDHQVYGDGLDHCYDCRSEIHIIQNYLSKKRRLPADNKQANVMISRMSLDISKYCSITGRLLSHRPPRPFGPCENHRKLLGVYESLISIDHTAVKVGNDNM
jgi:hypothetical protein